LSPSVSLLHGTDLELLVVCAPFPETLPQRHDIACRDEVVDIAEGAIEFEWALVQQRRIGVVKVGGVDCTRCWKPADFTLVVQFRIFDQHRTVVNISV
jgi:hypothetical protein